MDRWGKITINEQELFSRVVSLTKETLLDLNKRQLLSGITSEGVRLPGYSLRHIRARRKKGLQVSNKDLKFEGDFHAGFKADIITDGIEISSTDWKSDLLESQWGKIFGLTTENLQAFMNIFTGVFQREFQAIILS